MLAMETPIQTATDDPVWEIWFLTRVKTFMQKIQYIRFFNKRSVHSCLGSAVLQASTDWQQLGYWKFWGPPEFRWVFLCLLYCASGPAFHRHMGVDGILWVQCAPLLLRSRTHSGFSMCHQEWRGWGRTGQFQVVFLWIVFFPTDMACLLKSLQRKILVNFP